MIRDKMNQTDDFRETIMTPRPIFLVVAMAFIALSILIYAYDEAIIEAMAQTPLKLFGEPSEAAQKLHAAQSSQTGSLVYALLLLLTILLAALSLLCYRNPKLGNRLLGYGAFEKVKDKEKGPKIFSTNLSFESGIDEKKIHSRRREGRATRRKYAKITREMQQKAETEDDKSKE